MAVKLMYQMLVKLLCWIVLYARSDMTKEIEILVLRHQLAVLQRGTSHPSHPSRIPHIAGYNAD